LDDTARPACGGSPPASDAAAQRRYVLGAQEEVSSTANYTISVALLVVALGDRLVDALAVRAYREPRRVPVGHPLLPAQRHHRGPADRAVHDLVLQDIVGEPLVIPVTGGKVRPDIGVLAGPLLGKDFGTHGWESTSLQFWDGSSG